MKRSRLAILAASVLTLVSISVASLGIWRLGTDLGWAGEFVISQGFLSHWQVWIGAAIGIQYAGWRLTRYAKTARVEIPEIAASEEPGAKVPATANV